LITLIINAHLMLANPPEPTLSTFNTQDQPGFKTN